MPLGSGAPYGFLKTPLLLPWEVDTCASVPCLGQCIAIQVDPSQVECPATPALWPVRVIGNLITNVVVPLFALRLVLRFSGSIVSRVRFCPRACKQANVAKRWCWFSFMRGMRKFRKAGICVQCVLATAGMLSLYFFGQ